MNKYAPGTNVRLLECGNRRALEEGIEDMMDAYDVTDVQYGVYCDKKLPWYTALVFYNGEDDKAGEE